MTLLLFLCAEQPITWAQMGAGHTTASAQYGRLHVRTEHTGLSVCFSEGLM